jgi:hypothetical protein
VREQCSFLHDVMFPLGEQRSFLHAEGLKEVVSFKRAYGAKLGDCSGYCKTGVCVLSVFWGGM